MNTTRRSLVVAFAAGAALSAAAGILMGQAASQPVKSAPEYFVTADGEGAHLWVREGAALRVVGHGTCKECTGAKHDDHDHKDGDAHEHEAPAKK